MMSDGRLLALLHLCDSLFPIGAFAHSDGLEAATAAGLVAGIDDLRQWMAVCLDDSLGTCEGRAVLLACHAFAERRWAALGDLDMEMNALRPSSTARRSSRAMGVRLLKTWQQIRPHGDLERLVADVGTGRLLATLPVAFGAACASVGIEPRAAVEGFVYTRLAATVSCAMRLMPIGQHEAHALLASVLARVPAMIDAIDASVRRGEEPAAFTPALDIALMSQQYVHSRLFRS